MPTDIETAWIEELKEFPQDVELPKTATRYYIDWLYGSPAEPQEKNDAN